MKTRELIVAAVLTIGLPVIGNAAADQNKASDGKPTFSATSEALTEGEVRKVDKDAGKVTLKHGPLTNLGMPAMTMVFRVKDPAMLDQMKEGDRINFTADKLNGAITITTIVPVK